MFIRRDLPLTAQRAHELFEYDPLSGIVTRRLSRGNRSAGDPVGSVTPAGYMTVLVDGVRYALHRMIWLMQTGRFPVEEIDHINGQKNDNSWENLREATRAENVRNLQGARRDSGSGERGVRLVRGVRWRAIIRVDRKSIHLGYFGTKAEAIVARRNAEKHHFGNFSRQ